MTLETSLIDSALRNWRSNVDRAGKLFGNLSQEQLLNFLVKVLYPGHRHVADRFNQPSAKRQHSTVPAKTFSRNSIFG